MTSPLVSILVPTYNRRALIGQTVRAALSQTYSAVEVVVVDNASTDGTWDEIQALAATDARVRAFRNDTNVGPVRNWIAAAGHARGPYSKILWSDDLIAAEFLERCIPFLQSPRVGFVYTAARIFSDAAPDATGPLLYAHLPTGTHPIQQFIEGALLEDRFPYSPGCAVFRTRDLQRNLQAQVPNAIGSDFSRHAIGNDFLLFLLTAKDYSEFACVSEPLSLFRDHSDSISTQSGAGRLVLHYDIVRAYFSQQHIKDRSLLSRLNAMLWLHRRRFNGAQYGLHRVQDFYPQPAFTSISVGYLMERMVARLVRRPAPAP